MAVATMIVIVAQTAAPSPLYPQYQQLWSLTALELAGIFAVYVAGLLIVLLTAGSLSDYLGRKPVIAAAGVIAIGALILLASATAPWMVGAARVLQGASIGLVSGAAGAALLEFHLPGRLALSAGLNGALPPLAMAIGALGSAALSLVLPGKREIIYLVFAGAVLACTVLTLTTQERAPRRKGALASLKPTFGLPKEARPVFAAVLGALCSCWALAGLYVGESATIMSTVLHLTNPLASGFAILAVQGAAAVTGMMASRLTPRAAIISGLITLIIGVGLTMFALSAASASMFIAASVIAGAGYGAAFQTSLRLILAETPVAHRSAALSSVYIVSFLSFGLPSVIAGLTSSAIGFRPTANLYMLLVIVLAGFALISQARPLKNRRAEMAAADDEAAEEQLG